MLRLMISRIFMEYLMITFLVMAHFPLNLKNITNNFDIKWLLYLI